ERHESIGLLQQCKHLTVWRKDDSAGLGAVNAQVAQAQLRRLDTAFKRFFKGIAAYPRFKAFGEQVSLTYPQATGNEIGKRSGKIHFSRIGYIPFTQHRPEPESGVLKTITVKQDAANWYAVLTYEVPDSPKPVGDIRAPVGIDLGLSSLVALDNGETVAHPRFLKAGTKRLRRAQRAVSRGKKGSRNRLKAKNRLARLHAKVARQRSDFLHKLSDGLVKRFDFLAMEDLDAGDLLENKDGLTPRRRSAERGLHRGIGDAGWGQLRSFVAYKAARAGKFFVVVPARGTTQECSSCGATPLVRLTLRDRIHSCPCGKVMDRDTNAARNILKRGLAALSTLGHRGIQASGEQNLHRPPSRGRRVRSMKEEPLPLKVLCDN
ncbi:MAG: transposase, partial [Sulfuricaulis sp.]|nr:transposase [Sulfuricaulis sp.]